MANPARRLPDNVEGDLYVDDGCIDCDTCRLLAPAIFGDGRGGARVARQPVTDEERRRAAMALVSCPTASIGSLVRLDTRAAARALPEPVADRIYYCGFASAASYGASSWLVVRDGGNVLVDSPRFSPGLADRIEALGGARWLFLSHRDDVADHARWRRRLGCARVLHAADLTHDTADVEVRLDGTAPVALAADLIAVPVPGHTRGSTALLVRDEMLFTGDHLWGASDGTLDASPGVCWWSWPAQRASLARLLDVTFRRVLPGHGRPLARASTAAMHDELRRLLARLPR